MGKAAVPLLFSSIDTYHIKLIILIRRARESTILQMQLSALPLYSGARALECALEKSSRKKFSKFEET